MSPTTATTLFSFLLVVMMMSTTSGYQGDGLADCAPGKCPPQAEVSPIWCSSDLTMFFNNGFPTNCGPDEECNAEAADGAAGNPCRPVAAAPDMELNIRQNDLPAATPEDSTG